MTCQEFKRVNIYDFQPFHKGKYKTKTSQIAIKNLSFIRHLKITSQNEYDCWKSSPSSRHFSRLLKRCKTFETLLEVPSKLIYPLQNTLLKDISLQCNPNQTLFLLKNFGVKTLLQKLSLQYPKQQTNKLPPPSSIIKVLRRKVTGISQFELDLDQIGEHWTKV